MDYQDKLRLAKEALDSGSYDKETIEYIFPELKESEDEKIRKEIIAYLESVYLHKEYRDKTIEGWIDWLKKQGEEKTVSKTEPIIEGLTTEFQKQVSHLIASAIDKEHEYTKGYVEWVAQSLLGYAKNELISTDEIKPKFKVGDWVRAISSGNIFKILSVNDGLYRVLCYDGVEANYPIIDVEKDLAYWTIQDAKDGDVLYTSSTASNEVFLFKGLSKEGNIECYCSYDSEDKYCEGKYYFIGKPTFMTHPATKEKRDLLFTKMKEAGYEWDTEKKELKKIEQKPSWSEEDEEILKSAISLAYDVEDINMYNWLQSLKERVHPQPKQEWSEEDMETIDRIYNFIWKNRKGDTSEIYQQEKDANWLKALKYRVQPQPKQEWSWSEEDDYILNLVSKFILKGYQSHPKIPSLEFVQDWLKSLKKRYAWKPSDEQMDALNIAIGESNSYDTAAGYEEAEILGSLYEQLKKLKGE